MTRLTDFISVALLITALPGCVSIEQFPTSWEQADRTLGSVCTHISGTYADTGEAAASRRSVSLSTWLFEPPTQPSVRPQKVEIALSENGWILTVRSIDNGTVLHEEVFNAEQMQFRCSDGTLIIPRTKGVNREGVAMVASGSLELSRSKNFLIVNSSGTAAGIILLVPVVAHGNNYARFPSVGG